MADLPTNLEDLRQLIEDATAAFHALQEQERQAEQNERVAVVNAIGALETLLGPADASPSTGSIRGVLAYGTETIGANAPAVVPLLVSGLEQITQTVLSLAKVLESSQNN